MDLVPYLVNILVVLLVALAFPLASAIPPLGELIRWLDTLSYRWQIPSAPQPESSRLQVIDIDADSLSAAGARPAPVDRSYVADLIARAASGAPAAIVLDIDLRHRLRPRFEAAAEVLPFDAAFLEKLDRDDEALVAAVNGALAAGIPVVLGAIGEASESGSYLPYDFGSGRLYEGIASAWSSPVDRVVYRLPTFVAEPRSSAGAAVPAARPSLALAGWAAASGISAPALVRGEPSAPERWADDLQRFRDGREIYVNWYRLNPTGASPLIPRRSAASLLGSEAALQAIEGRIVLVGRSAFLQEPIQEQRDRHPTPFLGRQILGLDLQAVFLDNLLNRTWLSRASWLSSLAFGAASGILLGSGFIWLGRLVEGQGGQGLWAAFFTNPLLSFFLALVVSLVVGWGASRIFLQQGVYMLSIALIPLSGLLEAILYTAWVNRG